MHLDWVEWSIMGDISWGKQWFFVAETLGFNADMGLPVQLSISGTKPGGTWNFAVVFVQQCFTFAVLWCWI